MYFYKLGGKFYTNSETTCKTRTKIRDKQVAMGMVSWYGNMMVKIWDQRGIHVWIKALGLVIELYHAMLKQKILPVQPLIQCEAGRAKTKLLVLLGLKMAAVW